MKFRKLSMLALGFAFLAPSSCVPPVDAACVNRFPPVYTMWSYVYPNGVRDVNVQAWDQDTTKRRLFVYRGGTLVANSATGTFFWTMPKSYGTLTFATPNFDTCGGHTQVVTFWSVSN